MIFPIFISNTYTISILIENVKMSAYLVYFVSASAITEQYHCGHFVSASAISENIEMWVDLYPVLHCTVEVDLGRPLPPIPLLAPLGVTP